MPDQPPQPAAREVDELRLRPSDCPSREQLERDLEGPLHIAVVPPPAIPHQFSLSDIMILMVGAAAGLAGGSWMPADLFAGLLGLATLLGLVIVSWHPPDSRWGKLVWAAFVLAYFMAVLAAILRPPAN